MSDPASAPAAARPAAARIEPITGRYVHLEMGGRPHRVYFEEAGSGVPLVCLHTAGADGRQFRHLMTDEAVTASYRVMAFDMPWHGKSFPPAGWRDEEYRLTSEAYARMILAFCDGLALERPVVMGCSIGGAHGPLSRHPPSRPLPGHHRAGGRRLPAPRLVRPRLAAPAGHPRGRGERRNRLRSRRPAEPRRVPLGDAVAVHAGRAGGVPRRPLVLPRRRGPPRGNPPHRRPQVSALPAHRGVRLLLHPGGQPAHRGRDRGRGGDGHGGSRPFPDERGPGAVPPLPPARADEIAGRGGPDTG